MTVETQVTSANRLHAIAYSGTTTVADTTTVKLLSFAPPAGAVVDNFFLSVGVSDTSKWNPAAGYIEFSVSVANRVIFSFRDEICDLLHPIVVPAYILDNNDISVSFANFSGGSLDVAAVVRV